MSVVVNGSEVSLAVPTATELASLGGTGIPGPPGPGAYEEWLLQPGNAGKSFNDFLAAISGAPGAPGPATIIHATSGSPASTVGSDGDWAIDPGAGKLYGPKANGAWPAPISLVGPAGSAFNFKPVDIATAADLPMTGNAVDDAYVVDDTGDLYIWGEDNAWHNMGLFRGQKGDPGNPGTPGAQIFTGTDDPTVTPPVGGRIGDWYFNTVTNKLYKNI